MKRQEQSRTSSEPLSRPVGVRLEIDDYELLRERASEIKGGTRAGLARKMVEEALHGGNDLQSLRERVLSIHLEIVELRKDLALAVQVLMVASTSGKTVSQEEAYEWVSANMKR